MKKKNKKNFKISKKHKCQQKYYTKNCEKILNSDSPYHETKILSSLRYFLSSL